MCGIYLSCSRYNVLDPGEALRSCLKKRGPDHCKILKREIRPPEIPQKVSRFVTQPPIFLNILSTVLALRGDIIVEQPLIDPASDSVLCWNGEAWDINGTVIVGNDAAAVLGCLVRDIEYSREKNVSRIVEIFSRIRGPYAFVYYDANHRQIFYARDILGRRSLLVKRHRRDSFEICSISDPSTLHEWEEVEPNRIHVLDLCAVWDDLPTIADTSHHSTIVGLQERTLQEPSWPIFQLSPLNSAKPGTLPPMLIQSSLAVSELASQLDASLRVRVDNIPAPPCEQSNCARVAVLFSGGLDCTVLARLVHDIFPNEREIDLLNVAFENPRIRAKMENDQSSLSPKSPYTLCPDRVTGISSFVELKNICPGRKWRFVCIDVPYAETKEHRPRVISLIQPHNTEMDLSIAYALYFAARGIGSAYDHVSQASHSYTTPARVLLSGLGADEIFGGYQRHATAFHRRGYPALIDELELDFKRLGTRNLGRDDRVISHWGKEVRYPYLDESLVNWALNLPVWEKCGFGARPDKEAGSTDDLEAGKRLLRLLAWEKGLHGVASEKKRAIQFGARTAKMEVGKIKGTQLLS